MSRKKNGSITTNSKLSNIKFYTLKNELMGDKHVP